MADFVVVVVSPARRPTPDPHDGTGGDGVDRRLTGVGGIRPRYSAGLVDGAGDGHGPAGTASTGAAVTGPGALAFTGPGSGLARLFWLDLGLALLGGLLLSRRAPRRMRRTQ